MGYISNQWNRIRKNRDAKTLAGNFMWLSLLQVAGYVFPLITLPYLARVIGVDGFGKIAFAMAVMVWIQIVVDWGFNQTATRDVAQHRENKQRVSEIYSNVQWTRLFLVLCSLLILLILICFIPKFRQEYDVLLVTFLAVPGHVLFPDWFFQAMEKMKYISLLNMLMKLVFTIAIFVFIKQAEDYILQPLFIALGYVMCGIIALYYIHWKWEIKLYAPRFDKILEALRGSFDVFINNIAPNFYNSFSVLLLGFWGGQSANGIYEGGNKFYVVTNNFLQTLVRAFYPFLARRPEKHNLFVVIAMGATTACAAVLFIFAPWIVRVMLSEEFARSIFVIRCLAVSLVFVILYNCYGACYLIIHNRTKILRQVTTLVSLIGFLIAWPLVYYYTYIGAALSVLISRALLGILTCCAAKSGKLTLFR